jgi:hypothetical protein
MIFVFPLTLPANTPETAKQKTVLALARGKITRVMVEFPPGHAGLTHIGINRGLFQLWPANQSATFRSSNETIIWEEEYSLDTPPYNLDAYAWNEDDTYEHTITVRIVIAPVAVQPSLVEQIAALFKGGEAAGG